MLSVAPPQQNSGTHRPFLEPVWHPCSRRFQIRPYFARESIVLSQTPAHSSVCDVTRTVSKPVASGVRRPLSEGALSDFRPECWELVGQLCLQLLHLHRGDDCGLLTHGWVDSRTFKCGIIYKPFQTPLWVLPNLCLHTWRLVWASPSNRASPPWAPTVTAFDL